MLNLLFALVFLAMAAFGNDEAALLATIHAQPDEDTPRLVYADWLDENATTDSQRGRAEFIRLQIELARRIDVTSEDYTTKKRRTEKAGLQKRSPDLTSSSLIPTVKSSGLADSSSMSSLRQALLFAPTSGTTSKLLRESLRSALSLRMECLPHARTSTRWPS